VSKLLLQEGLGHLEARFPGERDEQSAAKFPYIKTVSGKVPAQSVAFRVVSIYWQGDDCFP